MTSVRAHEGSSSSSSSSSPFALKSDANNTFVGMMDEFESMSMLGMMMGSNNLSSSKMTMAAGGGEGKDRTNNNKYTTTSSGTKSRKHTSAGSTRDETIRRLRRSSLSNSLPTTTKVKFFGDNNDLNVNDGNDDIKKQNCVSNTKDASNSNNNDRCTSTASKYGYPSYVTAVHETFRRQDLPQDVTRDYWLNKQDIKQISKRNKSLAASVSQTGGATTPRRHSLGDGTECNSITTASKVVDNTCHSSINSRPIPSSSFHHGGSATTLRKSRRRTSIGDLDSVKETNLKTGSYVMEGNPSHDTSGSSSSHGHVEEEKVVQKADDTSIIASDRSAVSRTDDTRSDKSKTNDELSTSTPEVLPSVAGFNSTIIETEQEQMAYRLYNDTCRGLESLVNTFHRRLVRDQKRHTKQIVLNEQTRQYQKCEISPKILAKCARDASEPSIVRAYIQGQLDAMDVHGTAVATKYETMMNINNNNTSSPRSTKSHHVRKERCTSCITPVQSSMSPITTTPFDMNEQQQQQQQQNVQYSSSIEEDQKIRGNKSNRSFTKNLKSLFHKKTASNTVMMDQEVSTPDVQRPPLERKTSMYGVSA